jgi:hypothetical protein
MRSPKWIFSLIALILPACSPLSTPAQIITLAPSRSTEARDENLQATTTVVENPVSSFPPVTQNAIRNCPVTYPNHKSPEGNTSFNLGNDRETIFTIPWPEGKVIFSPNGPGSQHSDGSLGMKWPWYRTIPGDVVVTARRLDAQVPAPDPVILRGTEDGYGETGFHPSGLWFTSEGCWEVTAVVGEESLAFVTLVIKINFDPPAFNAWPVKDLDYAGVDLSGWPSSISQAFSSPAGGEIIVETTQGIRRVGGQIPNESVTQVPVDAGKGTCIRGMLDESGGWLHDPDRVTLQWHVEDLTYRITAAGLHLECENLAEMANSRIKNPR